MLASQNQILVDQLSHAGFTVSLTATGGLAVSPASQLTDDLRTLIRAGKSALVDWVKAANESVPAAYTTVSDIGTIRPPGLSATLLAASLALDAKIQAAGLTTHQSIDQEKASPFPRIPK